MAHTGHQAAFLSQNSAEDGATTTSTACRMLDALMHPVPLSVLALSVLIAMGVGPQLYYKRPLRLIQSSGPQLHDETTSPAADDFSETKKAVHPEHTQVTTNTLAGRKKRGKDRRKRGKDVSKETFAKPNQSGRQGISTLGKDAYQTREEEPLRRSHASIHTTFADDGTLSGSSVADDERREDRPISPLSTSITDITEAPTSEKYHHSMHTLPIISPPLPPSPLTVSLLSRFAELPSASRIQSSEQRTEPPIIASTSRELRPLSSPSPSASISVPSGIPTAISSSHPSRTPPLSVPLPTFQSLPTNISEGNELFPNLNGHIASDTAPAWIEGNSDDSQSQYTEDVVEPAKLTASVSEPVWDSSLDWERPNPAKKPGSDGTIQGVNSRSVETSISAEITASPSADEPFSFPSLNDPPPTPSQVGPSSSTYNNLPEGLDAEGLRTILMESKASEERWRLECTRRGEEIDRLKWVWTEEARKWSRREMELQQQLYRLLGVQNSQLQQRYGIPSPISGALPLMMPGMNVPGGGKPGAPFSPMNVAVTTQIHAPLPQFAMPSPTGTAPFPFNGMPIGMNVFGGATPSPGSPSRPGSTAPGNRRSSSYHHRRHSNSRHSSQSRASSPFSPQLNVPAPPTTSIQLSTSSQSVKSSPKSKMRVPSSQSSNGPGPPHNPISTLPPTNTMPRSAASSSSRSSSVLGGYDIESGTPIDLAIAESDEGGEDEDGIPEPLASAILKNPVKTGSTDIRSPSRASNSRKEIQRLQSISPDASPTSSGGVAMNDVDESQREPDSSGETQPT